MMHPSFVLLIVMCLAILVGCAAEAVPVRQWPMGPGPGDVYRDYTFSRRFGEVDPGATHEGAAGMVPRAGSPKRLVVDDLDAAKHAEVSVQYWGGHIGTSDQGFRINGGDWYEIPQPVGTPGAPQLYYRTIVGDNPVQVPLSDLKEGANVFQFKAGPQIRYGFNWGFYWVYSFTTRVYYDASKSHVSGKIASPLTGQSIEENPTISAEIDAAADQVKQVDFIALYDGYDWEGNGIYRQWHWQYKDGRIARHIGTASKPPYRVQWDTMWIPDQLKPVSIMARVVGADGTVYMTPAATDITFARKGRSVKMYKSTHIPERFGVRIGARKSCFIDVPDSLKGITAARLLLHTWSADHAEEIGLNDKKLVDKVGLVHDYSFDYIPVPVELIKSRNKFHVFSTTEHHSAEINWPGPSLLVEFAR